MMQPSPELEAISRRILTAIFSADGDTVVGFLATEDPLIFCGSAVDELTLGDALRSTYASHINEFPNNDLEILQVLAYESGDVGWSVCVAKTTPDTIGRELENHLSFVFKLERGSWKLSLIHNSVAISNLEVLGYEHVAMRDLLEAAEKDDPFRETTGMATLMFTDIVGSTSLVEAVGDARWTKMVGDHFEFVADKVVQSGGRMVKSLGDGTMSAFDSASAAMRAAGAIQKGLASQSAEPVLSVRIGLHTGDVVASGDDFFGTVVNKAARIAARAERDEVLVSDATRLMVGGSTEFEFVEREGVILPGLDGQHLICALNWQR